MALVHFRAGLMDGVSLEMEKWMKVLKDMGHDVSVVAGNSNERVDITVPELMYEESDVSVVSSPSPDIEKLWESSENLRTVLEKTLSGFDLIVIDNIWSLPLKIPLGLALESFTKDSEKPVIAHHHDFWWEREYLKPRSEGIRRLLEKHFPPNIPRVVHVVINTISYEELLKRRGMDSVIVPNVFDFSMELPPREERESMRKEIGVDPGDLVFLQATRITRRKAIELSIDFVRSFQESAEKLIGRRLYNGEKFSGKVFLVFSGMVEDGDYWRELSGIAEELGVRTINVHGKWDFFRTYAIANAVTYPTILEGWGNQLLEAVWARKPVLIFEYEVYKRDIKPFGMRFVSLGSEYTIENGLIKVKKEVVERAVDEMEEILFNADEYHKIVEENFEIARENFGLERLRDRIAGILEKLHI